MRGIMPEGPTFATFTCAARADLLICLSADRFPRRVTDNLPGA